MTTKSLTASVRAGLLMLVLAAFTSACAGNHRNQPYYEAQEPSEFFEDGKSARPLVPNTIAQGDVRSDTQMYTGKLNGKDVTTFPFPVTKAVLERGQQQYNAHCVPCHGFDGEGDGMIVRRGYSKPTSYHEVQLRNQPHGHYFDVITNGWGAMPSYANQVYPRDRWAIVAYIRALQLSQNADVKALPAEDRERLENPPAPDPAAEGESGEGGGGE